MKALAITDKGLEKIALMELDELIKIKGKAQEHAVLFDFKSYEDLFKFCYFSQSIERAILLLDEFEFKNYNDLLKKCNNVITKSILNEWFDKNMSFRVRSQRIGEHKFGSQTIEKDLGEKIILKIEKDFKYTPVVSMDSPDTTIYIYIVNNKAYLGIDLIGRDLSKRQYRMFTSAGIINANIYYALVRLANYTPKKRLIDIISKSGLISIEAALYASNTSINFFSKEFAFKKLKPFQNKNWDVFFKKLDSKKKTDKLNIIGLNPLLKSVEASKKNAKLAGVDKIISFSKMDVEWLDTKLDKNSIDIIASKVQCPSKHTAESTVRKTYKELFYQAEFIMKKLGIMILLSESTDLLKEMITKDFKLKKQGELWAGQQKYEFVIMKRK
ncbi:MAG: hypothetical protein KKE98_00590 [Nanoarchaeota archaeon]|nr:hypothetical protein [Nanoarchaeota archaeon]MBU1596920.1 hypothetical protein [Nanoarchaeota archaeon]